MEALIIITVLLAGAMLAPRYGRDSRGFGEDAWKRDALWSRDERGAGSPCR